MTNPFFAFVFTILVAISASAADKTFYDPKTEQFPMLTYEKFRSMRQSDQEAYLRLVQDFMVDLDRVGVRSSWVIRPPAFLQALLTAGMNEAQALPEQCQLRINRSGSNRYCVYCPSFPTASQMGGVSGQMVCGGTTSELSKNLADPTLPYPEFSAPGVSGSSAEAYKAYLDPMVQNLEDNGESMQTIDGAKVAPRVGTTVRKVTPSGEVITRVPIDTVVKQPSEAEPPTRVDQVKDDKTVTSVANTPGEKLGAKDGPSEADKVKARQEAEAKLSAEEARQAALEMKKGFMGQLRCIYAGFPILGKTCSGRSSFKSDTGGSAYTCDPENANFDPEPTKIFQPAKPSKAKILCNPMIFGLTKTDEPICVSKGANATAQCQEKAKANDPAALAKAVEIQKANPDQSKQIVWILTKLCHGDQEVLKAFMKEQGSTDVKKSVKDIGKTCAVYGERFSEYYNKLYSDGPRSGGSPTKK